MKLMIIDIAGIRLYNKCIFNLQIYAEEGGIMKKHTIRSLSVALTFLISLQTAPINCGSAADSLSITTAEVSQSSAVGSAKEKNILTGDVNSDGQLDDDDIYEFDDEAKIKKMPPQADVNADGKIDYEDGDIIRDVLWNGSYFPIGKYYNKDAKFISRAEFVHEIVDTLKIDISAFEKNNGFSDLGGCKYADEIKALSGAGALSCYDSDFYPDKPVDRDFAAYLINWCLGLESEEIYEKALENGWFSESEGEFRERLYVTEEENENILSILKTAPKVYRGNVKLSEDITAENDLIIIGSLDLNGHKLTAKKNMTIAYGGELIVGKGSVSISGDFEAYQAGIEMTDKTGFLCVNGNAKLESIYGDRDAGTMEFRGDVSINSMNTYEKHIIVFAGNKKQKAELTECEFANAEVRDSDELSLTVNSLNLSGTLSADGKALNIVTENGGDALYLRCEKLVADTVNISGNISGGFGEFSGTAINIDGDLIHDNHTVIKNAAISVTGNCQLESYLELNEGSLDIKGDLNDNNALIMENNAGSLHVAGNAKFSYGNKIAAGTSTFDGSVALDQYEFGEEHSSVITGDNDIEIEMNDSSSFGKLTIPDSDKRKVIVDDSFSAKSIICGKSPLEIVSKDSLLSLGELECSELSIAGNCTFKGNSSINAKKVSVSGSARIEGDFKLDGSEMTVDGDIDFIYASNDGINLIGSKVSGKNMTITTDLTADHSVISASGNIKSETYSDINLIGSDSVLKASGDITFDDNQVKGEGTIDCGGSLSFTHNATLKGISAVLSGKGDRTVDASSEYVHFASLEFKNVKGSNFTISGSLAADSIKADVDKLVLNTDYLMLFNAIFECDTEINGDVEVSSKGSSSGADEFVVSPNGHTLKINGDLVHTNGKLSIDEGRLEISGSYMALTDKDSSVQHEGYGDLIMQNEKDYMLVGGDFITISKGKNILNAGTLEIKGNFTQKSAGYPTAFAAEGTHKTILSGEKKQTVSFETYSYYTSSGSSFNYLEMTQKPEQYVFENGQCWKLPGDINEDGSVDLKDVVLMRQYIAGWEVEINTRNADVNVDNSIDMKDLITLRRYIAGGWDVTLK